jgi:hypothetical protein
MAKKTYNNVKKSTKEIPVCAGCLDTPKDSDKTEFMYFWVRNECSIPHYELFCIECIQEGQKPIHKPYSKPRGRPKGTKNTKKEK